MGGLYGHVEGVCVDLCDHLSYVCSGSNFGVHGTHKVVRF
jgi:hypothetical protein